MTAKSKDLKHKEMAQASMKRHIAVVTPEKEVRNKGNGVHIRLLTFTHLPWLRLYVSDHQSESRRIPINGAGI